MKKLFVCALIIGAVFFIYKKGIFGRKAGAFDSQGQPQTIIYTFDGCSAPCADALKFLDSRGVDYAEVNISQETSRQNEFTAYPGGGIAPKIIAGDQVAVGYKKQELLAVLAEAYGMDILTAREREVMESHFDDDGKPVVVMYSMSSCGYCRKAKEYFASKNIAYSERDIKISAEAAAQYTVLEGEGTPLIYVGFRRIQGCNTEQLDKAAKELL